MRLLRNSGPRDPARNPAGIWVGPPGPRSNHNCVPGDQPREQGVKVSSLSVSAPVPGGPRDAGNAGGRPGLSGRPRGHRVSVRASVYLICRMEPRGESVHIGKWLLRPFSHRQYHSRLLPEEPKAVPPATRRPGRCPSAQPVPETWAPVPPTGGCAPGAEGGTQEAETTPPNPHWLLLNGLTPPLGGARGVSIKARGWRGVLAFYNRLLRDPGSVASPALASSSPSALSPSRSPEP